MADIKIALLIPQQGAAGIWAPSAEACTKLAVHEINATGGLLRRDVRLITIDAGRSCASAAVAASFAVDVEEADAVVGMFPSYARKAVLGALEQRVPFIYTPQFEGFEFSPGVVTTGETAEELLRPGIEWLVQEKRARRFFLCGSDYIWPRSSCVTARQFIREAGGSVLGEVFLPLEHHDFDALLSRIAASGTQVLMPYFLGNDAIQFNRAFAEAGLATKILRFTPAIDETIVYGLSENATENLYISAAYFSTLKSRNNGSFLERYHMFHGATPPPANSFGQSCYEGFQCLASLITAAGTLRLSEVRRALGRTHLQRTARGDESTMVAGGRAPVHLARVDGYSFEPIAGAQLRCRS
jgi:ABC-type branched-subunit amino acid transport system substrate-binding protein